MSRMNPYVRAAREIALGRVKRISDRARQPVMKKIGGEPVRIAPLASMGAELLGLELPAKYAKAERIDKLMELAGKIR